MAAVTILGDDIVEGNETFQLVIQPTNPLDMVSTGGNTTTVTIVDNDGKDQILISILFNQLRNAMHCSFATYRSNCVPQ